MPPAAIVSIVFYYDSFSKSEKKIKEKRDQNWGSTSHPQKKITRLIQFGT